MACRTHPRGQLLTSHEIGPHNDSKLACLSPEARIVLCKGCRAFVRLADGEYLSSDEASVG